MRADNPSPSQEQEIDMQPAVLDSEVVNTVGQLTMQEALQPPLEFRRSFFRGIVVQPKMDAERQQLLEQRFSELREMGASEEDIKLARGVYRKGVSLSSIVGRGLQISLRARLDKQNKNL